MRDTADGQWLKVELVVNWSRGKLEFLLELGEGGQKESFVQGKDVVERIEDEVQQHFQLTDVILADLSGDRPCKAGAIYFFILQRWSSKWNEYVDVTSNKAMEDKDKVKVVLKYSVSVVKESFESHMKCVSSTA